MNPKILIDVKNLHKKFEGSGFDVNLFNGLNFTIQEKEFIAIFGEGGTGKTTLLNIISGLENPSEGKIFVFDRDLSQIGDKEITDLRFEKIGIVFQYPSLISSLTIFENTQLPMLLSNKPKSEQITRVKDLLDFFGILKKAILLPNELSLGERKKAEIARALVLDPPLLILDEPMANLDSPSINAFIPFLRGLKYLHDRTVLITTNSLKVSKIANREIYLEKPKILQKIKENESEG